MNKIITLNTAVIFDTDGIRVVGTYEDPWFIAKDICKKIGLINVAMALRKVPDKWRATIKVTTASGIHDSGVVNESGLYLLILGSKKVRAQKIKEWICEDVLPAIRKKGRYELDEKLQKLLEEKSEHEEKIQSLQNALLEEQKSSFKMKKSLKKIQTKFTHRHKLTSADCVYILENPDSIAVMYKIGMTSDINNSLSQDRTMAPKIKVKFIMYTQYMREFEKMIKIRCKDNIDDPAHEWVLDSLENLIKIYREINQVIGFDSVEGNKDLWKINMESPPEDEKVLAETLATPIPPTVLDYEERLLPFLKIRLDRYSYVTKNKFAPENFRWCNGFCQTYIEKSKFIKKSASLMTICNICSHKADMASMRILNGTLTIEQIKNNPDIVALKEHEQVCRKCVRVLNKSEFCVGKRQCKTCRNSLRSVKTNKFCEIMEDELAILEKLSPSDRIIKLGTYTRDKLWKISGFFKLGRKEGDKKQDIFDKICIYYDKKEIS